MGSENLTVEFFMSGKKLDQLDPEAGRIFDSISGMIYQKGHSGLPRIILEMASGKVISGRLSKGCFILKSVRTGVFERKFSVAAVKLFEIERGNNHGEQKEESSILYVSWPHVETWQVTI